MAWRILSAADLREIAASITSNPSDWTDRLWSRGEDDGFGWIENSKERARLWYSVNSPWSVEGLWHGGRYRQGAVRFRSVAELFPNSRARALRLYCRAILGLLDRWWEASA